jgi:hypothetical protein
MTRPDSSSRVQLIRLGRRCIDSDQKFKKTNFAHFWPTSDPTNVRGASPTCRKYEAKPARGVVLFFANPLEYYCIEYAKSAKNDCNSFCLKLAASLRDEMLLSPCPGTRIPARPDLRPRRRSHCPCSGTASEPPLGVTPCGGATPPGAAPEPLIGASVGRAVPIGVPPMPMSGSGSGGRPSR